MRVARLISLLLAVMTAPLAFLIAAPLALLTAAPLVFLTAAPLAWAADVAHITGLKGQALAGGQTLTLGDGVTTGTRLTTGDDARVRLSFIDGTEITLGKDADFTVDVFRFDPAQASGQALLRVDSGAFLVTTGAVGHLPDHPLTLKTPLASIGVRGTRFWGGSLQNPLDVLLLAGAVTVRSTAGGVDLDEPGQGTDIKAAGQAPTPVARWSQARIDAALNSVRLD